MRRGINTSSLCNDSPAKGKSPEQPTGFNLPSLSSGLVTAAGKYYLPLSISSRLPNPQKLIVGQNLLATPAEKLAQSLEALGKLQTGNTGAAICARDLSRTHHERLRSSSFLQEVLRGWYIPSRPDEARGREHGLVCLLMAFLRRLFNATILVRMVSLTGTISLYARRQLDGASTTHRKVSKSSLRELPGGRVACRQAETEIGLVCLEWE